MKEGRCDNPVCREAHDRLHEAGLMLREANHRIANSLQAAMVASTTVDHHTGRVTPMELRDQMMMRIAAIATVHRMMSHRPESTVIAFGAYLEKLAINLAELWSGSHIARIAVHHRQEMVGTEVAIRLGMVVNELVTNSCKYAYGKGARGEVRVGFSVRDGKFVLIVADDGLGIDADAARHRGTGSRLITDIARRLDAEFRYQPGHPGTVAILTGPAAMLLPAPRSSIGTARHAPNIPA